MSTGFTNPFRYIPDRLVCQAGRLVIDRLSQWASMPEGSPEREIEKSFAEGKMLGVMVVERPDGGTDFISAFSGTVKGADGHATSNVDGFVPPVIDLTVPDGYFKKEEAYIIQLNKEIEELVSSRELENMKEALKRAEDERDQEIAMLQTQIRFAKMRRDEIRSETDDPSRIEELIRESQFQKAGLKRLKDDWKGKISGITTAIKEFEDRIRNLKSIRAEKSDDLQKWIFRNAIVHNAAGESDDIWNIFAATGLIPPGGTGDCAAPKLLEYAFTHRLRPVAMGEFWYGKSPETAVRTHGHFYPSCTSRCGLLLGYMMKGMQVAEDPYGRHIETPVLIYQDASVVIVEKPGGMPSVPGLDGKQSLQEWLSATLGIGIYSVHRLDMDTSGVMVYAKTPECASALQKQFEEHTVRKTYKARVSGVPSFGKFSENASGSIELPLSPDYDERPRQKVDFTQGKPAATEYKIIRTNQDGTADLLLYPKTGRTHQLRVHCAHTLGLGSPIVGDLLYGSHSVGMSQAECFRLCLHALSITFRHPLDGKEVTFSSERLSY